MVKQITKICEWCGREFTTSNRIRKTCCTNCRHKLSAKTCKERGHNFKRVSHVDDLFLQKDVPEKYYFLGLMASDGCVYQNEKGVHFGQSGVQGLQIVEYIKLILDYNGKIYIGHHNNGKDSYSIDIQSPQLWKDLVYNGIVPTKTLIYKIPQYILEDENKLRNFLIGYIDGDGCIGLYVNMLHISFACSNVMVEQLSKLSLFKNATYRSLKNISEVRFNGIKAIHFGEWLYKDICVYKSHKYQKYLNYMEHRYEISERLFLKEQKEKVFEYLDINPETTSGELQKIFNISKSKSYSYKCQWRKKNGYI